MRRQSRYRATTDSADVIHAGLLTVQSDLRQSVPDARHIGQCEPAHLDLLACGQVTEPFAVLIGQVGNDAELARGGAARFQT